MAELQDRTPRDLKSRDKSARAVYTPPSNLPDPTPEPGWVYHWVGTHILGQANPTNVSQKMREGWEPVKAVDHPELMLLGNEKKAKATVSRDQKVFELDLTIPSDVFTWRLSATPTQGPTASRTSAWLDGTQR